MFHFGLLDQPAVEQTTGGPEDPKTTRYLLNSFGAPLGQQVTVHAGPDVVTSSYFVPDLRGNLSQLLGPGSSVKAIFGYDAYGKAKQDLDSSGDPTDDSLTNLAADSDSRLRYQMAPHDPLTGNYNLGPRLLNPNINRFVGADFYAAGAANMALQVDPLTGNRYLYAGANPAGLIDDGHKCGKANAATVVTSTAVRIPVQKCQQPASPSLEFPTEVLVARGPLVEINDPQPVGPFIESIPEMPKDPMSGYIITWVDPTLRGPYVLASDTESIDDSIKAAEERYPAKRGRANELHHIRPKYLGGDPKGELESLNPAYHQLITNMFRQLAPYGAPPLPDEEVQQ